MRNHTFAALLITLASFGCSSPTEDSSSSDAPEINQAGTQSQSIRYACKCTSERCNAEYTDFHSFNLYYRVSTPERVHLKMFFGYTQSIADDRPIPRGQVDFQGGRVASTSAGSTTTFDGLESFDPASPANKPVPAPAAATAFVGGKVTLDSALLAYREGEIFQGIPNDERFVEGNLSLEAADGARDYHCEISWRGKE